MDTAVDYSQLKVPNHVAIIVDGNGRWAKERGLPRIKGHDAGFNNMRTLLRYIMSRGVKVLSLYVFSTENFKRPSEEVSHLMWLFVLMYRKELKTFMEDNIKVVFSEIAKMISDKNDLGEVRKAICFTCFVF